jgi:hypothetical protein
MAAAASRLYGADISARSRYPRSVAAEDHVRFVRYKGLPILEIDFQDCQPSEVLERIQCARAIIGQQQPASVRTLTLVKGARFNRQTSAALKEYTQHNKPFVRAAAIVGLSGLQEVVYTVIVRVTGRTIATFGSVQAAKEFLVKGAT